jgi:hypothetical protein
MRDQSLQLAAQSIRSSLARRSGFGWTVRALKSGNLTLRARSTEVPAALAGWNGLTIPCLHIGAFVVAAAGARRIATTEAKLARRGELATA